jgi:hypothetical protein
MLPSGGDGKGREREGRDRKGPGMAVTGTAARRNGVSHSREADVVRAGAPSAWAGGPPQAPPWRPGGPTRPRSGTPPATGSLTRAHGRRPRSSRRPTWSSGTATSRPRGRRATRWSRSRTCWHAPHVLLDQPLAAGPEVPQPGPGLLDRLRKVAAQPPGQAGDQHRVLGAGWAGWWIAVVDGSDSPLAHGTQRQVAALAFGTRRVSSSARRTLPRSAGRPRTCRSAARSPSRP